MSITVKEISFKTGRGFRLDENGRTGEHTIIPKGQVVLELYGTLKDDLIFDVNTEVEFEKLPKEIHDKAIELHNLITEYFSD